MTTAKLTWWQKVLVFLGLWKEDVAPAPAPATLPVCTCPSGKGDYVRYKPNSTDPLREVIIEAGAYLPCQLRAILNDGTSQECGIADFVRDAKAVRIIDGKLEVDCFKLPNGDWASYVGMKQPSTTSLLVKGQGVPVNNGLLRLFFVSRK